MTHVHARTHARTHPRNHAHTHTRTHIHTHTRTLPVSHQSTQPVLARCKHTLYATSVSASPGIHHSNYRLCCCMIFRSVMLTHAWRAIVNWSRYTVSNAHRCFSIPKLSCFSAAAESNLISICADTQLTPNLITRNSPINSRNGCLITTG